MESKQIKSKENKIEERQQRVTRESKSLAPPSRLCTLYEAVTVGRGRVGLPLPFAAQQRWRCEVAEVPTSLDR